MPGVINRYAQGLLGLLDMKTGGNSLPPELAAQVLPILDLVQFYVASARERRLSTAISIAAVGTTLSDLVVPVGKMWVLEQAHVSVQTLTAGQVFMGKPCVFGPAPASPTFFIGEVSNAYAAGDQPNLALMRPGFLLLNSGSNLGVQCERIAAGPIPATLVATIIEIQQ